MILLPIKIIQPFRLFGELMPSGGDKSNPFLPHERTSHTSIMSYAHRFFTWSNCRFSGKTDGIIACGHF
jgi:hypothetical protein